MEFPKIIYEEGDDLPRIRSILGPRVGAPSPSSPPSLKSPAPPTPSPATVKSIPLKSSASVAETHARLWQPGKRVAPQAAEEVEQTPTLPAQAQAPAPPTVLGGWNPARRWQGGTPAVAPEAAPLAKEPSVELTTPSLAPAQEQTPKLSLAHTPPPLITVEPESTAVADAMVAEVESATHRIGSVSGRAVGAQAPNRGAPPSRLSSLFDADALSTQPLDPVLDAEVLPAMAARVIVDRVGAILSLGNTTLGALGVPGELQAPPETRVASIAEPQPTLQPLPTIEAVELSKPPAVPGLVKPSALTPPEHPQSVVASSLMQGASESLDPVKAVASPASCDLAAAVPAPVETRGVALQVEVPSAAAPVLFDPVEDEAPQEPVSDAAENPEADANGLSLTATDDLQVQSAPDAVPTDNPSGHGSLSDRAVEAAIGEGVPTEVCAADANGPSAVQAVVVEPPNAIAPTQAIEERDVAPPVIHLGEIDMAYGWRASVAAKAKARSDAAIRHQNPSIVAAERANALPAGQTHGGKNPNLVTISIVTEATVDAPIVPVINVGEPDAHPNPVESAIANVTNGGEKDAALANTQSAPEVEDNDFEGADAIAESDSNIVLAVVEALVVGENEATEAVPPSLPPIGPEDGSDLVNTDEGPEEDPNEAPECVVQGIYNAPTSPAFDAKDRSAILTGNVAATLQDLDCDADADLADIPTSTMTIPPTIPSLSNPQDRLVQACLEGQFKLVGALLADGADPNAAGRATSTDGSAWEGITPLQATILATASVEEITPKMLRKQTARIVKVLLSRGALTLEIERDLVHHCANHNLAEVLEVLAEHNVRLRRYGYDLISIAMHHGHLDVLQVLNNHDCVLNLQNDKGSRPFLDMCSGTVRAAITDRKPPITSVEAMTDRLCTYIALGLDLEAADKIGATPLMRAIVTGNETMAWALLTCGASPRVVMRNGVSITHLAAVCMGSAFLRQFLNLTDTHAELRRLQARRLQPDVRAIVNAAQAV